MSLFQDTDAQLEQKEDRCEQWFSKTLNKRKFTVLHAKLFGFDRCLLEVMKK